MHEKNIKGKAVSGMAWTGLERLASQGIQFVIGIVIARILMPTDYGIMGMLAVFVAIAQTFLDSGFASALIQKKNRTEEDYSTVFYFNIVVSLLLYGIFYVSAPWIASFYNMPILSDVTRVTTLSLIVGGLSIVQQARMTINLDFRYLAAASITAVIVSGTCGMVMAYSGFGVWALVFQGLVSASIRTAMLWIHSRWFPRLVFSVSSFQRLFSFGSKLLCSGMINTIYNNLYTLIIGKAFNASEVGFYTRANQFSSLPSNTVTQMVVNVNFPILSKMQDDDERLLKTYRKLLCTPLFLLAPILLGMASVAHPMVAIILGEKWLPCVPYLQILCIGSLFNPLTHINLNLLYVKGRSDFVLKLELIKKPIAFVILFASIPFGIWWMCFGAALYNFIAFVFNCHYTKKMLNYGLLKQLKELSNIFINGFVMSVVVALSMIPFENQGMKFSVGILVGVVSYTLYAYMTKDESFNDIRTIIINKFRHA